MSASVELPCGDAPEPLSFAHFPDVLHAVVWRNWELVDPQRIAEVVGASVDEVRALATSMGLSGTPAVPPEQLRRNYVCIIRRNWHLLPYEQLCALLGWDRERMAFTLREDDFLYHKLGMLKPRCEPVRYRTPDRTARRHEGWIRDTVERYFGLPLPDAADPPFGFLAETPETHEHRAPGGAAGEEKPRIIYSYSAVYGDPLLDPALDPYPESLLGRLAGLGVKGVWLQGILTTLAGWELAPELGEARDTRLENLRRLVERARRFGIGVYLYLNEPRAMPVAFFSEHPELQGVTDRADPGYATLCTSTPEVQRFLREASREVFARVPGLAGAFTITMSENLTNCHSKGYGSECPRCSRRSPAEVVAEVNRCLAEGIWSAAPEAKVLVWDWGWSDEWARRAVDLLPSRAWLMSVSEWDLQIERGGVSSRVGEYSLSSPGPGPRAVRHWGWAREHGMRTAAKMQINNTWELSSVPYVPVLGLVAEHLAGLSEQEVDGMLLSWTLGGYPSPNLDLLRRWDRNAARGVDRSRAVMQALEAVAAAGFPARAASRVVRAWMRFSEAFRHFPYHIQTVYLGPQNLGPANLLFAAPTGYRATMVGFPYDDLAGWRGIYPEDVFEELLDRVARGWREGLEVLRAAGDEPEVARERGVAEACLLCLQSAADQVRFVRRRGSPADCLPVVDSEIATAVRMFDLANHDSRLGFEATNHYFFTRLDLVEKVLNCRRLREDLES